MKIIKTLILFFLVMTLAGMLGRGVFYVAYRELIASSGETGLLPMLWHGLKLDLAVAGYVTLLPTLLVIVASWWNGKALLWFWRGYQWIVVAALTIAFVANIGLYKYWGFPLDSTPLFFVQNSPEEFIACLTIWQIIFGPIAIIIIIVCFSYLVERITRLKTTIGIGKSNNSIKSALGVSIISLLLLGVEFIIIRGGFDVSVNNVGDVYFSENIRLNHATVNPVFSFVDSVLSDEDFSNQYRFMDDKEADSLFNKMIYTEQRQTPDSVLTDDFKKALVDAKSGKGEGVRVVVVIMESFSRYIMSDGGMGINGVVPNIERLAQEGVYFTNFYANSFRTDRGTLAILSGFPAQPTMSLMKFPHKTNDLYSIARTLKAQGFKTKYIFGGDANFTNCRSYLKATGIDNIIDQDNYPANIPRGKWGVEDGPLFERALEEAKKDDPKQNIFRIVQTSSSHEPFEVPWHKLKDKALNSFNYADDCIGRYVAELKKRPDWNRTLLVFVPDHLGSYPEDIDNFKLWRYQIPLIFAGGAINGPRKIDTIGTQHDIAATLLALLDLSHKEFTYSKDMLDPQAPHFAFFDVPDAIGMVTKDGAVIYDNTSGKVVLKEGQGTKLLPSAKAYLQKMYDDIAKR